VLVRVGEREIARPCSCRQSGILQAKTNNANLPTRFFGAEIKNYKPDEKNPSQKKAKEKCIEFIKEFTPGIRKGLLILGPTGVGKTRLLCSIGNELIKEKNADVFYIDWNDLTREMRSGEDTSNRDFSNISQIIQRLVKVDLLLFDELGASRPSPWVIDNIYYLINRRYNEERTTVFASNYIDKKNSDEETLNERIGPRIRSRLYEMTEIVEIAGKDFRQEHH
jgi:DNA replication protein DnaC